MTPNVMLASLPRERSMSAGSACIIPAAMLSRMRPVTAQPMGRARVRLPRRSSSLAPGRVKGVPAASATVGDLYREYLADRAAGIPQKETDKAVRLPDERNTAKDQRRDIYAMRGNQTPAYEEWDIQNALYDAMDHADAGDDNMIRVGEMPRFVTGLTGIEGDFYLYRNHAYENTVTAAEAKQAGRFDKSAHYHGLGMEKMTDAI